MKKENSSYNQILKSTTIFGGSQLFIILIGILRTKIVAVLLGPLGIGLIGIYQSVIDMMRSAGSLGIDTAGVKEIAEFDNDEDREGLFKIIVRFNWWFLLMGLVAMVLCIVFAYPISLWAFDDSGFTIHIMVLSLCVFLAIFTTGRSTILQGLRRIPEMAKSSLWGSLLGLFLVIPVYYIWGIRGIIPAFVLMAIVSFACVEYYYRKQKVEKIQISIKTAFNEGIPTLKFGLFIVGGTFIGTVSMFIVKAFISRNIGLDAAGLFQSAWAITNVYLALILRSMGSDFFPRLSAIATDKEKVKALINEQTYIVLVIASPIIILMMLFADFGLTILYSDRFSEADMLLRLQVLGTFFKVLSWPIAFILLAKNKGILFLLTESAFYLIYLVVSYILFPLYGLEAVGVGYLVAYIVYLLIVFIIGKRLVGFTWDNKVIMMTILNLLFIVSIFSITQYTSGNNGIFILGIPVLVVSFLYSFFQLKKVFSLEDLKEWFRKR